ncbi:TonB-dependent receptor [Fimbriimonas ginsengisoli Gsoil 348]|uniref:TonB-dependent receptor n=1 Tax=Fimbriimonas ginsengisoli Gsoil 348 TaxID=661478 RepID=A0A068NXT9_FIMGI|nr:TonB-dependent receptor [Fimbriimonas ginsengisoli Gsoil 348]
MISLATLAAPIVQAAGLAHVRFVVVDPLTRKPVAGFVTVATSARQSLLATSLFHPGETPVLNPLSGEVQPASADLEATTITIPLGATVTLRQQDQVPTKEIVIRVTATRIAPNKAPVSTSSTTRNKEDIQKFVNTTQADTRQLTKGQAGVAEDSAGQQHVRGEHTSVSYVIDGVPLPDTLSGRQGAVVVPSTIETLEIITGGFAPEFGGQTAAVLNVTTLPNVRAARTDVTLQGGSYNTFNSDLTAVGPLGKRANYVINLGSTGTDSAEEPPQPDNQTAHNRGTSRSAFAKLRISPNSRDAYTITVSNNPADLQIANRTGLPASFAQAGQGYGLFGLRNADGTRPDVTPQNAGLLGAQTIPLPSQQAAGQDINQSEINEFAILNFQRHVSANDNAQLGLTLLHGGQEVDNRNPAVDLMNLPVDNSIEFNPTASRTIHHVQLSGAYNARRGSHRLKAGFLLDSQTGTESYKIEPASQLALDAIAAIAPGLAPPGSASADLDINGNPVYTATGPSPTLKVSRTGTYKAAYLQDTWIRGRLTANYGLRGDWYNQNQDLGQPDVSAFTLSPRLNFQYQLNKRTDLRWSYNKLFNTPPLAQGAILGAAVPPEIVDQYDVALSHKLAPGQSLTVAYYYKQIKDQVDVGLLIPGSQIGLYSAVSLEHGGVHGLEISYDLSSHNGWDAYLNYSRSAAKPNGKDNTGADTDEFNDHDQRHTVGVGIAYTWKSGASAALTYQYGSGLASSIVPPSEERTPRDQLDLHMTTGERLFRGQGGLALDVQNAFDSRKVINFQSAFSGTRFQQGRRILLSVFGKF